MSRKLVILWRGFLSLRRVYLTVQLSTHFDRLIAEAASRRLNRSPLTLRVRCERTWAFEPGI
jgi:hypothetical protein